MKKQLLMGSIAVAVMAGASVPAFADGGLSASAGAASQYLWRGQTLNSGGEIFGDLNYSVAGFYGDAWITSGSFDEYDLSLGYKVDLSGVGLDVGVVNYNYSGTNSTDTTGQASEGYLKLSAVGATLSYYHDIASRDEGESVAALDGGSYYSLSYTLKQFTALVGHYDYQTDGTDYTHVDLTYAYNDSLSFTASKVVDPADTGANSNQSTKLVVSYNFPIK